MQGRTRGEEKDFASAVPHNITLKKIYIYLIYIIYF